MSSLRFYSLLRFLISYGRCSGLPLRSSGRLTYSRIKHFYDIFIFMFLILKAICTGYGALVIEKFEVRLYVFSVTAYCLSAVLLILFFVLSGDRFMMIVNQVDNLTERLLNSGLGHEDLLNSHYLSGASWITKFMYLNMGLSIFGPLIFCTSVPIMDFLQGHYRSRTAVPGQCPFELDIQKTPGVFEIIVFQQGFTFFIMSAGRYVTECLLLGFYKVQSTYFLYLSATLRDIGNSMKDGNSSNKKFLGWIKLHQDVIKNAYELSSAFSPVIVLFYFSTIILVTGPLILLLDRKSMNILQSIVGTMAMLNAFLQLYLQCHFADEVTTEGRKLALGVYSMPWTGFGKKDKGFVRQIITMCNQPIYIEGYRCPAFRLDKATYQAMFLSTISTFMAFQKIRDINELQDISSE